MLLTEIKRSLFHEWLVEAGLDEKPFVVEVDGEMMIDYSKDVGGGSSVTPVRWRSSPHWALCVWGALIVEHKLAVDAVLAERHRARAAKQRVTPILPHDDKVQWRRFLLLVSADPVMRRAIETTHTLGGYDAAVSYIRPLFQEFTRKVTVEAPFAAALSARQARRARRLDGRAARPTDRAYAAETAAAVRPRKTKAGS